MMATTADALDALLRGQRADDLENDHLDFKEPSTNLKITLKILADAAVCFANGSGGDIVLGVNDKAAGAAAFIGVPAELTVEVIRKGIYDRTRPQLTCLVDERAVAEQRVITISVPQGVIPHSNSSGTSTRRLGRECLPFTPDQQRELLIAKGQLDFSAEPCAAVVQDLSAVEFDRLRRLLRLAGKEELASLSDRRLLDALRLTKPDDDRLTHAALLLLGNEDALERQLPTYGYSYQFRPSIGSEATGRIRERRPVLAAIESITDAVAARVQIHPLNLAGGVQLRLSDYPLDAVRELVVNGFLHRSYETHGSVDIEHTPSQLVISSPGGLVAGITPGNILTYPSTPRNRLLTETVTTLQIAERTGQGVDRVYREMLRSGKEPPQFEDLTTLVRVVLAGGMGNDSFVRFVSSLPDNLARDVDILLVLSWLRRHKTVTASDIAPIIQRSIPESQRVLAQLADEGLMETSRRTASRPTPTYHLRSEIIAAMSRAVSYGHRSIHDRDQKVVEHIQEYGFVTNRTIQRLFDTNVYTARNLLTEMRHRGLIEKIGDARGGPGVKYGPGPRFPA